MSNNASQDSQTVDALAMRLCEAWQKKLHRPIALDEMSAFMAGVQAAAVEAELDARRYRWLRERNLDTIQKGGEFAGDMAMKPSLLIYRGDQLAVEVPFGNCLSVTYADPKAAF